MPDLFIIAGPNGAGKTTAAQAYFPELLGCVEFVNADLIAAGISPHNPASVAIQAGRIMLRRLRELLEQNKSFAFETTLASKSFVSLLHSAKSKSYKISLLYFWIADPEMAIGRVADRVKRGGHHIPDEVVRRRYRRGLQNLFDLYLPCLDNCYLLDNGNPVGPSLIASQLDGNELKVNDIETWDKLQEYLNA